MNHKQRIGWKARILLFLTSQCITLFGSTLVQMALVWYAAMQTSSGGWVAAFSVCAYLPSSFCSPFFGVRMGRSRYPRKKLIMGADALIAAATLLMVLAMQYRLSEALLLAGLLVMSAVRSLGAGVQNPAVQAVIPQLVPAGRLKCGTMGFMPPCSLCL